MSDDGQPTFSNETSRPTTRIAQLLGAVAVRSCWRSNLQKGDDTVPRSTQAFRRSSLFDCPAPASERRPQPYSLK